MRLAALITNTCFFSMNPSGAAPLSYFHTFHVHTLYQALLPSVMTAEGWEASGGGGGPGGRVPSSSSSQSTGKVETALSAAESNLRVRTESMALQVGGWGTVC